MEKKRYYVTTPIYYPSGKLHIGHAYTTVAADVTARYKRLQGYDVRFLTGIDEHGQKIEEKAKILNISPQKYVDKMSKEIQDLWKLLNISYDDYIRTTNNSHKQRVQNIFQTFLDKGDIYKGKYQGWYSISDETFYTEAQLVDIVRDAEGNILSANSPDNGQAVTWVEEEAYFFKMSKYANALLDYYKNHPDFVKPNFRLQEMINNFIEPGLQDLAVTRTSFDWGIRVPGDEKHVIYVWIDALSNYITTLGYGSDDTTLMDKYWPANLQLIGKEITRFHVIYWPIMLMALDLPLPKQIFSHGWILMKDGKMSKSKGNVIYPEVLVERYGLDALRYYLMREIAMGKDGVFTPENFIARFNYDLANDLGNLLSRTIAMIVKYRGGVVPKFTQGTPYCIELEAFAEKKYEQYNRAMDNIEFSVALEESFEYIRRLNKYIDQTEPWVLAKDETKSVELDAVLSHLANGLRQISYLIAPVLVQTAPKILKQLGLDAEQNITWKQWNNNHCLDDLKVHVQDNLFQRVDNNVEIDFLIEIMQPKTNPENNKEEQHNVENSVDINEFKKIDIRVGEVLTVSKHPYADRLLLFTIDFGVLGKKNIVSGLAQAYPNYEKLVGKKLLAVTNLAEVKIRKVVSEGMILTTETEDEISIIEINEKVNNGTKIE